MVLRTFPPGTSRELGRGTGKGDGDGGFFDSFRRFSGSGRGSRWFYGMEQFSSADDPKNCCFLVRTRGFGHLNSSYHPWGEKILGRERRTFARDTFWDRKRDPTLEVRGIYLIFRFPEIENHRLVPSKIIKNQ